MKKTLRQQAKDVNIKILENNEDFYNEIVNQYFPEKEPKPKRKLVLKLSSIASACLLFIAGINILLYCFLNVDNVEYLMENEVVEDSNIVELQNLAPWFSISQEYTYQVTQTYDSISEDILYFEIIISGNNFVEKASIYLYINPNYKTRKQLIKEEVKELYEIKDMNINGTEVHYIEKVSQNSYGLYIFSYKAQYEQGKNEIYIEYEQTWIDENTHFFAFLEEMIV